MLPASTDTYGWLSHWAALGQTWRRAPEIDSNRKHTLDHRQHARVDVERGEYPFHNMQPKLSRSDIEWLLAEHNGTGGFVGPVQWNKRDQNLRNGLDLRGADLRGVDLSLLPLTRTIGGLSIPEWQNANSVQRTMATLHLEGALLYGARLEGALLIGANLTEAEVIGAHLQRALLADADLRRADLSAANLSHADLTRADLSGAKLQRAQVKDVTIDGANLTGISPANKLKPRELPTDLGFPSRTHIALFDTTLTLAEDPLGASNLSRLLRAVTTLHTKCYLIQQRRFADLARYVETGDLRFEAESNLIISVISYNSPALIKLKDLHRILPSIGIAMRELIDAISLSRARLRSAQLDNDKKTEDLLDQKQAREQDLLNQQLARQIAERRALDEHESRLKANELQQLEVEKRRTALGVIQSLLGETQGVPPQLADALRPEFDTIAEIEMSEPAA